MTPAQRSRNRDRSNAGCWSFLGCSVSADDPLIDTPLAARRWLDGAGGRSICLCLVCPAFPRARPGFSSSSDCRVHMSVLLAGWRGSAEVDRDSVRALVSYTFFSSFGACGRSALRPLPPVVDFAVRRCNAANRQLSCLSSRLDDAPRMALGSMQIGFLLSACGAACASLILVLAFTPPPLELLLPRTIPFPD